MSSIPTSVMVNLVVWMGPCNCIAVGDTDGNSEGLPEGVLVGSGSVGDRVPTIGDQLGLSVVGLRLGAVDGFEEVGCWLVVIL